MKIIKHLEKKLRQKQKSIFIDWKLQHFMNAVMFRFNTKKTFFAEIKNPCYNSQRI